MFHAESMIEIRKFVWIIFEKTNFHMKTFRSSLKPETPREFSLFQTNGKINSIKQFVTDRF